MSKLLGGFLDDGPQFVIRVVVVVLFGIGSESKCKYLSIKKLFHHRSSNDYYEGKVLFEMILSI